MERRILALDPGKSGGLVWCARDGSLQTAKMPDTEGNIRDLLRSAVASDGVNEAWIENIPKYVGHAIPSSAAAVLFDNFGLLKGLLMGWGIKLYLVTPQTWQKPLRLGTVAGAGGKPEWKRKLLAEAQRRYPTLHLTLATADACLIYDHAHRCSSDPSQPQ
jgi:hypothetical protein